MISDNKNLNLELPYGYLLSATPINISGIGTAVSPKLSDLYEDTNLNKYYYNIAKLIVSGTTEDLLTFVKKTDSNAITFDPYDTDKGVLSKYEILVKTPSLRDLFKKSLSLFFKNIIVYSNEEKCFLTFKNSELDSLSGIINKNTFPLCCSVISQLMHAGSGKDKKDENDLSSLPEDAAKALRAFEKYSKQKDVSNYKNYQIDNIISKMCAAGCGYNLLNIYNLTVWQLYDQFEAYSQCRISAIAERSFSVWGGEDFDYETWLKNNN